jgi:NAD(P)-dependent dehydrogenase (short-subunit alcohol dehydrogenase family)
MSRDEAIYPSLDGRTVLITGGATGIGAALVRAFARQQSRVAFLDRDSEAAGRLGDALRAAGLPPAEFEPCDLRDITALRAAVRRVEARCGPVRVLVNNAGNDDRHELDAVEPEYWDERMAVNLRHYFFAAQAVHAGMAQAGGGAVVNLGSIAWRLGLTRLAAYSTAKAGILGLTKALAAEFGPERIRVNCIEPGSVRTERQIAHWLTPEFEAEVAAGQCLPGRIEPDDVAKLALFLAADDSRMCTGQAFLVDAGWV